MVVPPRPLETLAICVEVDARRRQISIDEARVSSGIRPATSVASSSPPPTIELLFCPDGGLMGKEAGSPTLTCGALTLHPIAAIKGAQTHTDLDCDADAFETLVTLADWVESYLCAGHPQLGRIGAVCPWCPTSVEHNVMWLATTEATGGAELEQSLADLAPLWRDTAPKEGALSSNKAFIVARPNSPDTGEGVLELQKKIKPGFVKSGLMFGEFFPTNDKTAVRSDTFKPLRAPVPLLVVRDMVPLDAVFLAGAYFDGYLDKFGDASWKNILDALHPGGKPLCEQAAGPLLTEADTNPRLAEQRKETDLPTGFLKLPRFLSEVQSQLDTDRSNRPMRALLHLSIGGLSNASPQVQRLLDWKLSRLLREFVRGSDSVGRSGENFYVCLNSPPASGLRKLIRRCRSGLSTSTLSVDHVDHPVQLTQVRIAVEAVKVPLEDPWQWDGTTTTTAQQLMDALVDVDS